jgi:transcriptional regulator with XRE-family HTH domain
VARAIFGRNVRRCRQQKNWTQEELAFEAKIDLTYLGGIERGKRNPSLLVVGIFLVIWVISYLLYRWQRLDRPLVERR